MTVVAGDCPPQGPMKAGIPTDNGKHMANKKLEGLPTIHEHVSQGNHHFGRAPLMRTPYGGFQGVVQDSRAFGDL